MRKFVSILLLLCLFSCVGIAENLSPSPIASPIASPGVEEIESFENSKFGFMALIRPFSDNITYAVPIVLNTNHRHLTYSTPTEAIEGDCFIIDADCNIIGNVFLAEEPQNLHLNITLAPNKYEVNQIVYLVWVAD